MVILCFFVIVLGLRRKSFLAGADGRNCPRPGQDRASPGQESWGENHSECPDSWGLAMPCLGDYLR